MDVDRRRAPLFTITVIIAATVTAALVLMAAGCLVDFGDIGEDPDAGPVCGNQRAETGESCDGSDLAGQTCSTLALGSGILGCQTDCLGFDTEGCGLPGCGNGIREGNETCDGSALAGATCEALGWGPGVLACRTDCVAFDFTSCAQIGLGEPCTEAAQCVGGQCLDEQSTGAPEGFCSSECETELDCSPGFGCYLVGADVRRCLARCTVDTDSCRTGYACVDPGDLGENVCWPFCQQDTDCPSTGTCDAWTGLCRLPANGMDNGVPCVDSTDCKGGICRVDLPGGYCVSHCVLSAGICPEDNACVNTYEGTRGDLGQCYDGCTSQNDCRAGWDCITPAGVSYLVCWPVTP